MTKRIAVIAQARMGSSRLPGKVLETIGKSTVLQHVLSRAKAIPGIDVVCCATTTNSADDGVAAETGRVGSASYRGSVEDVLGRYHAAATELGATIVMRVTCDCPLIDAVICGEVLSLFLREGADYAANNLTRGWPHGLDCEVFTMKMLSDAHASATSNFEREHVTPWMRGNSRIKKLNLNGPGGNLLDMRWTLDFEEDLAFFRALDAKRPLQDLTRWTDVVVLLEQHPELKAINAGRIGVSRPAPIERAADRQH